MRRTVRVELVQIIICSLYKTTGGESTSDLDIQVATMSYHAQLY